ncbi:MAG: galactose mutarotase [Ignavibacteriae bacterium]|nr:galactose mutarotase [Ignavibacteriota bacterium]
MNISSELFGKTKNKKNVDLFTLKNNNGMSICITNYGGIIQSLTAPNRDGKYEDVILGYDKLESYLEATPYFGAIVGRYANRIANGQFTLDQTEYTLAKNDGNNHLHGGINGFDKVVWNATPYKKDDEISLKLEYLSEDGEEGFPGNLKVSVIYSLTNDDTLKIEYSATTDKKTHVNLTNHNYFNLTGDFNKNILDHKIFVNADRYIPINSEAIPLGSIDSVVGTAFDFTTSKKFGKNINDDDVQLQNGFGYDHCLVFKKSDKNLPLRATVYEEKSGRVMQVFTDQPAVQLYIGNHLDGSNIGKGYIPYEYRAGLCLETQHFPDSPNNPSFPSTVLTPGEIYSSKTFYKFSSK